MDYALEINGACKRYERFALEDVSLRVPRGTMMGLIGENGAGKTTLIHLLMGVIRLDAGEISLLGARTPSEITDAKARVGVVLDAGFFPSTFNAHKVERCCRSLYPNWDTQAFAGWLRRFDLPEKQKIKDFSRGMLAKLKLAVALSHGAELLVLDEATSGLDPVVRSETMDIFQDFMQDERHAILFSTHITTDLERVADEIAFLHRGKIVLEQSKDDILENYGVLKCGEAALAELAADEYAGMRRGSFGCEVLLRDRARYLARHPDAIVDRATLDDVMVFTVRGNEQ